MNLLEIIDKEWKLDAKSELPGKYFYKYDEVKNILEGNRCFVIGRKGSGKTAICEYIISKNDYQHFAQKLSFKNFPFNQLYKQEDTSYNKPNQYITIWKYLIYCKVCEMMRDNVQVDSSARNELIKLFPPQTISNLRKDFQRMMMTSGRLNCLSFGIGVGFTPVEDGEERPSFIEGVDILENFIINYADDSPYFIIFDELDEDYSSATSKPEERDKYFMLLTSLLKAVQDVKSIFLRAGKNIRPIVFLRDDIYRQIQDSDKNKWRDFLMDIKWDLPELKRMVGFRLAKDLSLDPKEFPFEMVWEHLVHNTSIGYGRRKGKSVDLFEYISYSTLLRPRDFISFITLCCREAIRRRDDKISLEVIRYVDREFSNYFLGEFKDELMPLIPDLDSIFTLMSGMHKQVIPQVDFRTQLSSLISKRGLGELGLSASYVTEQLFQFSIIGNLGPETKDNNRRQYFKYTHSNMTLNNSEPIIVHRGLLKALHLE